MKKSNKKVIATLVLGALISTVVFSQQQVKSFRGYAGIPDLTEEQQTKIDGLRTEHQKLVLEKRAEIQKLQAELKVLELADKPDQTKVNAKIDEISKVRADILKAQSKHRQDVRAQLTDDQKVYFDAGRGPGMYGNGNHVRGDMHSGINMGYGQGRGGRGFGYRY